MISELEWFFKVLDRAHYDTDELHRFPTLKRVDNVDLTISIEVTWQFMFVTLSFLTIVYRNIQHNKKAKDTIESLRELGASEENIKNIESDIDDPEKKLLDKSIDSIKETFTHLKDENVEASLRAYFGRIKDATEKGYQIGTDTPKKIGDTAPDLTEEQRLLLQVEIGKLSHYDRMAEDDPNATPKSIEQAPNS